MPVMPPHGIPPEPAWLRSRTMPLIAALALACISAFAVTVVAASMDFLKTVSAVPSTMSVTAMETISSTRVNPRFVRLRCKFSSVVAGNVSSDGVVAELPGIRRHPHGHSDHSQVVIHVAVVRKSRIDFDLPLVIRQRHLHGELSVGIGRVHVIELRPLASGPQHAAGAWTDAIERLEARLEDSQRHIVILDLREAHLGIVARAVNGLQRLARFLLGDQILLPIWGSRLR